MARAAVYQGTLAKPPGSLGELENIYIRLCGIAGTLHPRYAPCRVVVLCADNGVTEEGVSVTPRSVTAAQAVNMTKYLTGMSAFLRTLSEGTGLDAAVFTPLYKIQGIALLVHLGGQLCRDAGESALAAGLDLARQAKAEGIDAVGVGEMGIGNTTTSSAVLAALTGLSVERVTGRGGGMTDEGFALKKRVIASALVLHKPNGGDVLDTLCKVGGLDIAAMCGVFLGAARCRLPAVIDGLISAVAALCAVRLCPAARDYLFASHLSREIGYQAAIKELGLAPWLHLGMRLGEGSGCPIAFRVLESACAAAAGMATFQGAAIDDSYLSEIRGKDCF